MSKLNEKDLVYYLNIWVRRWSQMVGKEKQAYLRIRELIKIFFAKEISAGPIKKDISQPDLIKWLQGINQAATAVKDYYVMKATTQLIEMLQKPGVTEEELFDIKAQEYERGLKDAQPKVTEEFIKKWADVIHQADTGLFGIKGELKLVRQMLKEAGVGVA